jgi:hypothetical protein
MTSSSDTKQCPHCNESIKVKATRCKHCKQDVGVVAKVSQPAPKLATTGMRDCPECGQSVKAKAMRCKHCKRDISVQTANVPRELPTAVSEPAPVTTTSDSSDEKGATDQNEEVTQAVETPVTTKKSVPAPPTQTLEDKAKDSDAKKVPTKTAPTPEPLQPVTLQAKPKSLPIAETTPRTPASPRKRKKTGLYIGIFVLIAALGGTLAVVLAGDSSSKQSKDKQTTEGSTEASVKEADPSKVETSVTVQPQPKKPAPIEEAKIQKVKVKIVPEPADAMVFADDQKVEKSVTSGSYYIEREVGASVIVEVKTADGRSQAETITISKENRVFTVTVKGEEPSADTEDIAENSVPSEPESEPEPIDPFASNIQVANEHLKNLEVIEAIKVLAQVPKDHVHHKMASALQKGLTTHLVYDTSGDANEPWLALRESVEKGSSVIAHMPDSTQLRRLDDTRYGKRGWAYKVLVTMGENAGLVGFAGKRYVQSKVEALVKKNTKQATKSIPEKKSKETKSIKPRAAPSPDPSPAVQKAQGTLLIDTPPWVRCTVRGATGKEFRVPAGLVQIVCTHQGKTVRKTVNVREGQNTIVPVAM